MDEEGLYELLTELEETVPVQQKAERFAAEAQRLERGEYGRASLLVAAGEHWMMRGELDHAHTAFEAALADGGESAVDAVAASLHLALERGDTDAATRHRETLLARAKANELGDLDYHYVGETYETNGDLREALRWFTMPFTYADPDDEDLDDLCLFGRLRVREALGLGKDRFDLRAIEELDLRRADVE